MINVNTLNFLWSFEWLRLYHENMLTQSQITAFNLQDSLADVPNIMQKNIYNVYYSNQAMTNYSGQI